MGIDDKQRLKNFSEVCNRLENYLDEEHGITMDAALKLAKEKFPKEKFDLNDLLILVKDNVLSLRYDDTQKNREHLQNISCASLVIIDGVEPIVGPFLFLWGKYLFNSIRFSGLQKEKVVSSPEEYLSLLSSSKSEAKKYGWSELEALRQFYDYFFNSGWYYYPDQSKYYPEPIGSTDFSIYQLVIKHFLLSFPRTFTIEELHNLLLVETKELEHAIRKKKRDDNEIAFEATDVLIYCLHILNEQNLDVSKLMLI